MESWRGAAVPQLPGRGPETIIWDTPSGRKAAAAAGWAATLYGCGITPYDATHIGHAATYIAWDLLIRAWRDAGHQVSYVQNVTDVDDPLLERAAATGEDWRDLAAREIARFRSDMEALRVLPPAHYVSAVEAMNVITGFNRLLADRGALYDLDGDVYFARSADPEFGVVSGLDPQAMAELSAERGGDPGRPGKKDPLDPVVWRAARPGEPAWESDFGAGRPGWHVECAAIATQYLGSVFDVQVGGTDLIFPHHEMSASHARVALGAGGGGVFARRYAHAGMVHLDGEKMSKSRGNLVFVSRLLAAGADPMAIRLAILAHHYRTDWDWTEQELSAARERLARWREALALAGQSRPPAAGGEEPAGTAGDVAGESVVAGVRERLSDDLDAPGALAVVDRWAGSLAAGNRASAAAPLSPDAAAPLSRDAAAPLSPDASPDAAAPPGHGALVRDAVDALLGIAL